MTEAVREFEGKDLDEAIGAAAEFLGVDPDTVHFEILDTGRKGILGLGAKQVRIRVEVPDRPARPAPRADEAGRGRRRRARSGERPAERKPKRRPARPAAKETEPEAQVDAAPPAWLGDLESTVGRMFELMGFDVRVRASSAGSDVRIDVEGPDRGELLKNDGEVLTETAFLLNRMSRRTWPGAGRIRIECDGFRDPRETEIVELAREVARQVDRTRRPKRLHPMNPYERRIVHVTVQEFPGLVSRSEGNGFLKRIRLSPREDAPDR